MTLAKAHFYWLECNQCGAKSTEHSEFAAWQQVEGAVTEAQDSEWDVPTPDGTKALCPDCAPYCANGCGKPAGELCGEREYMCVHCWLATGEASA